MSKHVVETDIKELKLLSRGKVRDIYEVDDDKLLLVTTDRISAYDVIMPNPIDDKGKILNQITLFWMDMFKDIIPNHLIASKVDDYPEVLHKYRDQLEGRSVLVKKAKPLPIECIVRGYITGSGWKDYQKTGEVCGHKLPEGLKESEMLEQPLFTPSTKAELGEHDENISVEKATEMLGKELFDKVQEATLSIYKRGRDYAREKGIIIADTKFEFGIYDGELIIIDEVLTPDSSRFWPVEGYEAGKSQPSFDKQFLRDWLTEINFNKQPPAPEVPEEIATKTRDKYMEAFTLLTESELDA
ncbi:phosphoribosylaminoimidazolesuccinocarboxamide synthase [Maridesulfovibrio salexigens]|uniref:Phosphoribosylaminoimidazole-succinocarboxamide synthase n=1 Tax=Maridesulfovibrio salexigens (strain ATCC 14822 / DSM 2638 / NCIMB 8403 / VKM B-1763) TaxID=526222 RepID=PUR7_MARSD|nr:phosphoribosylaminoimidazolesuccinocarboxamide synthase [Maridesulfovibrio salexigens]C6BVA6.1 RecName: Full=Phosphoribosylaminoimidazole-succinocarboxamide synthase; AltName: Full=SAICAR synthetase [Maridesulfovibrio salexigens DSM 2638]ACS80081.1 phosphoribosylaminoimidazole-succinocarboxamide synthase [Maridesulfovibrio salexigens DSM 2638]